MKRLLAILLILLALCKVRATDIYVSQNGAGAQNGTSAANAYPLSWNTLGNWPSPPAMIHMVGTITGQFEFFGGGTSGNPITLHGEPGSSFSSPCWTNAAVYCPNVLYIVLDSLTISNSNNGTALGIQSDSTYIYIPTGTNVTIQNCNLPNVYVRTPGSSDANAYGIAVNLGGIIQNLTVSNCVITQAKYGISLAYNPTGSGLYIYSNNIYGCSVGINVGDAAANCHFVGVYASNNIINGGSVWSGASSIHCDATHIFAVNGGGSYVSNYTICANSAGPSMGVNLTSYFYPEGVMLGTQYVINNIMTCDSGSYPSDGFNFCKGQTNVLYANNTICTATGGYLVLSDLNASGNLVYNNICYDCTTAIYTSETGDLAASDYNDFFGLASADCFYWNNSGLNSLASWQSTSGFDSHSITNDPAFANVTAGNFTPSSVVNIGTNLSAYFTTDRNGNPRPATGTWSAGALNAGYPYGTWIFP
jgi:hypothetical protein